MAKDKPNNRILRCVHVLQAIINIALPSFAYGYYLKNIPLGDYNLITNFQNSAFQLFPLALIFIFFMQLIRAKSFEKDVRRALLNLILPFVYLSIANIFYPKSISWYLFEMGAIYGSSLLLAFFVIVFFTVIFEGSTKKWDAKNFGTYSLMAIPQLLFLIPGIIGVCFFNKLIIQDTIGSNQNPFAIVNVIAYLASLIQISFLNYRWMRKEAAI